LALEVLNLALFFFSLISILFANAFVEYSSDNSHELLPLSKHKEILFSVEEKKTSINSSLVLKIKAGNPHFPNFFPPFSFPVFFYFDLC